MFYIEHIKIDFLKNDRFTLFYIYIIIKLELINKKIRGVI